MGKVDQYIQRFDPTYISKKQRKEIRDEYESVCLILDSIPYFPEHNPFTNGSIHRYGDGKRGRHAESELVEAVA